MIAKIYYGKNLKTDMGGIKKRIKSVKHQTRVLFMGR